MRIYRIDVDATACARERKEHFDGRAARGGVERRASCRVSELRVCACVNERFNSRRGACGARGAVVPTASVTSPRRDLGGRKKWRRSCAAP